MESGKVSIINEDETSEFQSILSNMNGNKNLENGCTTSMKNMDNEAKTISDLPPEVVEYIFTFIAPYEDLKSCSLVCKQWYWLMRSAVEKIKRHFEKAVRNFDVFWELSVSPERQISKRFSHAAVLVENSMYVFGGCTPNSTTFNDLWRLNLNSRQWERPLTIGSYPSPKASATMVHYKNKLFLFGGWTYPSRSPFHQIYRLFDELHSYNIDENRWSSVSAVPTAPPTASHSATVQGDLMVVFGGRQQMENGTEVSSNLLWCFNMERFEWTLQQTTDIKPERRYGQSQLSIDQDNLIIIGGCGGPNMIYSDVWILTLTYPVWTWRQVVVENPAWAAPQLWCHPACKVGNLAVVLSCSASPTARPFKYSNQWNAQLRVDRDEQNRSPQRFQPPVQNDSIGDVVNHFGTLPSHVINISASSSSEEDEPSSSRQNERNLTPFFRAPGSATFICRDASSFHMVAFRAPMPKPTSEENRRRQLQGLRRMEEKLKALASSRATPPPIESPPSVPPEASPPHQEIKKVTMMYVMDISEVLTENQRVEWLEPKTIRGQEPEEMKLYSLVTGNGELIAYGGILRDTVETFEMNNLSNSLHFIRPNRYIL